MNQMLKPTWEEYDCNLIDYPPQLSILTINTLSCADEVDQPLSAVQSPPEDIQKIACVQRKSVSDLLEEHLAQYRKEYEDALIEYERLKNEPKI